MIPPERLIICTDPLTRTYSSYTGAVQITRKDIRYVNSEGPPNIPTETGSKQYSSTAHPETPTFCKPLRSKTQREPRDLQRPEVFRTSRVRHLWNWSRHRRLCSQNCAFARDSPDHFTSRSLYTSQLLLTGCPTNISTPFH